MNKLRLLLTEKCNRSCKDCCNKGWDLNSLPVCKDYYGFDEFLLTGGEPMLIPETIKSTVHDIRQQNNQKIYMYTANCSPENPNKFLEILDIIDGVTLTLHDSNDILPFKKVNELNTR